MRENKFSAHKRVSENNKSKPKAKKQQTDRQRKGEPERMIRMSSTSRPLSGESAGHSSTSSSTAEMSSSTNSTTNPTTEAPENSSRKMEGMATHELIQLFRLHSNSDTCRHIPIPIQSNQIKSIHSNQMRKSERVKKRHNEERKKHSEERRTGLLGKKRRWEEKEKRERGR